MTHNIKEKIAEIQKQFEQTVQQHNTLVEQKAQLFSQATELQGALKVLQELDDVPDQSSDTEST